MYKITMTHCQCTDVRQDNLAIGHCVLPVRLHGHAIQPVLTLATFRNWKTMSADIAQCPC